MIQSPIYSSIIKYSSAMAMFIAIIVILGWCFHIEVLKSVIPGLPEMKFNTAICFLLLAIAPILILSDKYVLSAILSSIVFFIASASLLQTVFGYDFGIDQLLIKDFITQPDIPDGRMAPTSSLSFIVCSGVLLGLRYQSIIVRAISQYLLHLVTLISFLAILGYIYGVPAFYKFTFTVSMALHTALVFFFISISITLFNPSIGFAALFTGRNMGNIVARRLFPYVFLVVILLGFIRIQLNRYDLVSVEFGIALLTTSFIITSLLIIANTVKYLNGIDRKRTEAEVSLKQLNDTLDNKVKERTEELEISEEKFHKIFEMSPVGLLITDIGASTLLDVNQSFTDLTGYSKEGCLNKSIDDLNLVLPEDRNRLRNKLIENGYLKAEEVKFFTESGEKKNTLMSVEMVDIGDKKIGLTALSDITKMKLIEKELKAAKVVAEESALAQERFMANMSHEIRTPMNAIIGFANLIKPSELSQEQEKYLNFIKTSGENLLVLINDILDYSKIEAGMMHIEKIPFSISDLIQSIQIMFSEKANSKRLILEKHIEEGIPEILIGDPTRLTQIMINLLSNAIKFTTEGKVQIKIKAKSFDKNSLNLEISVKDTGIGIPADRVDAIFDRFTQASSDTTRHYGGTGLGLSIVKRLVELQHGSIVLQSVYGEGSEFVINLPFEIGKSGNADNKINRIEVFEGAKLRVGLSVLIVEDNVLNQLLAKKILTDWGCLVDVAENGGVAIEMIKNKNYDVILMDIQMPVMDGYEASKVLRYELKIDTPIIAMTAHVMAGEREKCISMGMTDYISKPFKLDALSSLIHKYTSN